MEKLTPILIEHEKGKGFTVSCLSPGCNTVIYTSDKDGSKPRNAAFQKIMEHVGKEPLAHDIQIKTHDDLSG